MKVTSIARLYLFDYGLLTALSLVFFFLVELIVNFLQDFVRLEVSWCTKLKSSLLVLM